MTEPTTNPTPGSPVDPWTAVILAGQSVRPRSASEPGPPTRGAWEVIGGGASAPGPGAEVKLRSPTSPRQKGQPSEPLRTPEPPRTPREGGAEPDILQGAPGLTPMKNYSWTTGAQSPSVALSFDGPREALVTASPEASPKASPTLAIPQPTPSSSPASTSQGSPGSSFQSSGSTPMSVSPTSAPAGPAQVCPAKAKALAQTGACWAQEALLRTQGNN